MHIWGTMAVVIVVLSLLAFISTCKSTDMRLPFIWGFNAMLPAVVVYCFYGEGDIAHKTLVAGFVGLYLLRMNIVLTVWYANTAASKLGAIIPKHHIPMMSVLMVLIFAGVYCLPFYWACNRSGSFGWLEYVSVAVYIVGTIWHFGGDYQKRRFKQNPTNKGKLINTGFWGLSRHPNYFGDFLIYASFAVLAGNWWGLVAPITNIMQYFSDAIPKSEKMAEERYGELWLSYKKKVRCFIPYVY